MANTKNMSATILIFIFFSRLRLDGAKLPILRKRVTKKITDHTVLPNINRTLRCSPLTPMSRERDFLKYPFISNFRAVVLMRLVNYTNHSVTKTTHDKGSFSLSVHAEIVPLIMAD